MTSRSGRLNRVPNTLEATLLPKRPVVTLALTKPNLLFVSLEKKTNFEDRRACARLIILRIE